MLGGSGLQGLQAGVKEPRKLESPESSTLSATDRARAQRGRGAAVKLNSGAAEALNGLSGNLGYCTVHTLLYSNVKFTK